MPNKFHTIVVKVRHLTTFHQKSKGLIGEYPVFPITFRTRWGIHTFGMKTPIDVLILDDNYCVVHLTKRLPANRFFFWNPGYSVVVELPAGDITRKQISLNDHIVLK